MSRDVGEKKLYFILYDYGTGGIWRTMMAPSKRAILDKYPELQVVEEFHWSMKGQRDRLLSQQPLDIDEEPSGWLAALVKERSG